MSIEILYEQPKVRRVRLRGASGDTLTVTSIHDGKSVWAKREDGLHTNLGLDTLSKTYYLLNDPKVTLDTINKLFGV